MLYRLVAFSKGGRFSKNTNNGVLKQSVYIDFGKNNGLDGNVTEGPDQNGHYWNNAIETEYGETLELVSGTNESTGFIMEITKKFLANGIRNGGLLVPDQTELGDLAISTAHKIIFILRVRVLMVVSALKT